MKIEKINNNHAGLTSIILLECLSVDLAGSTISIDSTIGEQFLLWNSGNMINVMLVGTPQSPLILDLTSVQE
jgi:hypothetical protein